MIEAKVPRDIRSYKTKMIGPLTLRQFLCIFIIGIMDFAIYSYIIKPLHINIDLLVYIFMFLDLPIAAFGWIEPMNMPLEKYLRKIIVNLFITPKNRKPIQKFVQDKGKKITAKEKRKMDKKRQSIEKHSREMKGYL